MGKSRCSQRDIYIVVDLFETTFMVVRIKEFETLANPLFITVDPWNVKPLQEIYLEKLNTLLTYIIQCELSVQSVS